MSSKPIKWRISASIILTTPPVAAGEDYNLLVLKRSDATSIMPNQCVFPGGLLDADGDESVAWLNYFEEFGVPEQALRRLVVIGEHRPAILAPQGTGCYDRFFKRSKIWAREITLRLTALRECFEEVGVLLCRSREQLAQLDANAPATHFREQNFDRQAWQHRVHGNPREFLSLCRELKVVPDLWALHEWAAWASPAIIEKRYETVFFVAFLDEQPNLVLEPSEVKECLWRSPRELLQLYERAELWFLPPQIYELTRLMQIKGYNQLKTAAVLHSKQGASLLLPVAYMCDDGTVYVLPGDDLYVPEPHLVSEPIMFPGTIQELRNRSKHLHRYENEFSTKLYLPGASANPSTQRFQLHKL
ncbi:hypothetical protein KR222_010669 [Zaprionus bogoriensis]|nr:hypothetical protein KR222_010669 [Zaprionus bogoriensis]